jgi:hypothetical protein
MQNGCHDVDEVQITSECPGNESVVDWETLDSKSLPCLHTMPRTERGGRAFREAH